MITNQDFITGNITTNAGELVPYRWTHGATTEHMGDGLIVYSIIQHMRAKTCVCIGSGGGFIPRIMTQARLDLHKQNIFEGNPDINWGDIGVTYIVDACNGIGGPNDLENEESYYHKQFQPRLIKSTSEDAYYNFFVLQDDTDATYEENLLVTEDNKKDYYRFDGPSKLVKELENNPDFNLINLHNFRILPNKPSSTGITIINKKNG